MKEAKKVKIILIIICSLIILSHGVFAVFPSLLYPHIMNFIYRKIQQNVVVEQWNEKYNAKENNKNPGIVLNAEYLEGLTSEEIFPFKMNISKIDFEWIVNEDVDKDTLKKGPGHITGTVLPGQYGRCAISAHRTTYGAPFFIIDEIKRGDIIEIESPEGLVFYYEVKNKTIFEKTDPHILGYYGKRELVLIGCAPKYTLIRRIGIVAELKEIIHKGI